jgi:hypothetical protein
MQQTMMQFEKQNEIADAKEDMMDDLFNDGEDEEEGKFVILFLVKLVAVDETISQVLDSIGLDVAGQLPKVKTNAPSTRAQQQEPEDKELERMLAQLNAK